MNKQFSLFLLVLIFSVFAFSHLQAQTQVSLTSQAADVAPQPVSPLRAVLLEKLKIKDTIALDLFVMSHCPFGVRAEQSIIPLLNELGSRVKFQLHYVAIINQNGEVESMHGTEEVEEDLRQVVIARLFPDKLLPYLLARAKNYQGAGWQEVAEPLGISTEAVEKMMGSAEGKQMLLAAVQPSVEKQIHSSPTLFIDGENYMGRIMPPSIAAAQCNVPQTASSPIIQVKGVQRPVANDDIATSCTGQPDGTACDDGNACTTGDICQNEVCVGQSPVVCNDNSPCTDDVCNPVTGCVYTYVGAKNCDDNNVCTIDQCNRETKSCVYSPVDCDDHNPCTQDRCNSVTGCSHTPVNVDDNNACTTDACDIEHGITHTPVNCDDNDPCTQDVCDTQTGCNHIPTASATISASGTPVCENGSSPVITFTGSGGTAPYTFTYAVGSGDPQTITDDGSGSVTLAVPATTPGIFTYNLLGVQDASGLHCAATLSGQSASVTVSAPTGSISGSGTYCSGANIATNLTLTVTGIGTISGALSDGTTFSGTAPTIYVSVSPAVTTTYTIASLSDSINCTAQASDLSGSATITVNPAPAAPISGGDQTQCAQSPIQTLTATATGGTITWYDAATNGNAVADPALSNVGSATYYAQASDGTCSSLSRTAVTLTIKPLPVVNAISYTGNTSVCSGSVVSLTDATAGGVWSSSNAAAVINSSGTVTFTTVSVTTQVTIYYTVTSNGCAAQASILFTVNPPLSVKPITGNTTVCGINGATQLSDLTTGGTWSSSNTAVATVSTTGLVTGKAIGSAIIYYTVAAGGCSATVSTSVSVNTAPTVAAISGSSQVVKGNSIKLTDSTKGGVWSSSNTAVATVSSTGVVKGITAGSCTIYYTVTSDLCSAVTSKTITVYNPLLAMATVGTIPCYGGTATLTINASGGSGGYQYSLNGGKYQTSNTFTVPAGVYIIIVTDQMANQFTLSGIIVTQPAPLSVKLVSVKNASSKTAADGSFTVSGSGGMPVYQYSKNGGVSYQTSGTFTSLATGSYKVSIKDANNCIALNYLTVTVGYGKSNSLISKTLQEENVEITASVYPNPSVNGFNLRLKSSRDETVKIRVMDIIGHIVYQVRGNATGSYTFGAHFTAGMYIVEVVYKDGIKTLKAMKQ